MCGFRVRFCAVGEPGGLARAVPFDSGWKGVMDGEAFDGVPLEGVAVDWEGILIGRAVQPDSRARVRKNRRRE